MKKKIVLLAAVLAAVALVTVVVFSYSSPPVVGQFDAFAQCLTEKGAKFYGSWQCGHCSTQKTMLGSSMKYVDYVECGSLSGPVSQACIDAGVQAYPTWVINGKTYVGVQSLQTLSSLTGCSLY